MKKISLFVLCLTYSIFAQTVGPNSHPSSMTNDSNQTLTDSVKAGVEIQRLERAVFELRNQVERLTRIIRDVGLRPLFSCYVRNSYTGKTYPATEYTLTAAKGMALKLCSDESTLSNHCRPVDLVCDTDKRE